MSFVQLAERGIESAKAHVVFQLLPRRGLEPMLVGRLLALFPCG